MDHDKIIKLISYNNDFAFCVSKELWSDIYLINKSLNNLYYDRIKENHFLIREAGIGWKAHSLQELLEKYPLYHLDNLEKIILKYKKYKNFK